jgi:hypothetical protein
MKRLHSQIVKPPLGHVPPSEDDELQQQQKNNQYDNNNQPIWPTWAVGALSGVRNVLTSTAYVFTYPRC